MFDFERFQRDGIMSMMDISTVMKNNETTKCDETTDKCDICGGVRMSQKTPGAPNAINIYCESDEAITEGIFYKVCRNCMHSILYAIAERGK